MKQFRALLFTAAWAVFFCIPANAAQEARLWEQIRDGSAVVLLRHALAPGTGDPANFTLGECATQRNLSDEGREQARAIGTLFRAQDIERADVYTSQWCRCLETARLLDLGPVTEFPVLNSFFRRPGEETQTAALRSWLAQRTPGAPTVLVTHQVNITALTGIFPASGELVVVAVENGAVRVLDTVKMR